VTPPAPAEPIDYVQWRALLRAYLWIDFAAVRGVHGEREARRAIIGLAVGLGLLTAMGLGLAAIVWISPDAFSAAVLVTSSTMLWVAFISLAQVGSLATPEDLGIVGFRPVSSSTLFAVRITALLVQPAATTLLLGWLPALAFFTRVGGGAGQAAAAAAGIGLSSVFTALAIVTVYGWLIRRVPPERLARALAWAGALAGVAITALVVAASERDPTDLISTVVPRDERTLWIPAAWFAAYVAIAEGVSGPPEWTAAAGSLIAVVGLVLAVRGRVSSEYVERVSDLAAVTATASRHGSFRWLRGEARAVTLLVACHLRHDVRFQLALASALAMGLVFTVMGTSAHEWPADPFAGATSASLAVPVLVLLWLPAQLHQALVISPEHEASWMLTTPAADRGVLVVRARDAVALSVLVPLVLLFAAFFTWSYGHLAHALLHATMLGAMAYGLLQVHVLLTPRLPFSVPMTNATFAFGPQMLVMFIGAPVFIGAQFIAYRSTVHYVVVLALIAGLTIVFTRATQRRACAASRSGAE
jgi:hypothetical protein